MQRVKELPPRVQARIKLAAEAKEAAKVNKAQSKGVKKEFVPLGREWSEFTGLKHARVWVAGYQALVIKSDAEWFLVIDTDDSELWVADGAMHEDKPGSEGSFLIFKVFGWCVDAGVPGKVQLEGAPMCFKGGWTDLKFSKTSSREEDDNLCAMARDWVAQRNAGATAAAAQSGQ